MEEDGGSPQKQLPERLKVLVLLHPDGFAEVYAPREQGRLMVEMVELRPGYTAESQVSSKMYPVLLPTNIRATGFPRYTVRPNQAPEKLYIDMDFDYTDERGEVIYQALHFSDGNRGERCRDVNGHWDYDLGGRRRVLYRLPELLAADPRRMVLFTTSEETADRLCDMGMVATTCSLGFAGWRLEWFGEWLKDRNVTVLADRGDREGLAKEAALDMLKVANSVKFLAMPNTLEKVQQIVKQTPKLSAAEPVRY